MQEEKQNLIIAVLTGTFFVCLFGFITFLVMVNFMRRKRKILLENQMRESQFQQELLMAELEMQDHTFRAVSQEIHDNIGQILSIAKLHLSILTYEGKGQEELHLIKDLVSKSIDELRDLSKGYYTERLVEEGLLVAIKHQYEQLSRTGLFKTTFQSEMESLQLDKNKTIFLYRMVQEIINNIVKHSSGTKVGFRIFKKKENIIISIEDNGKGFLMDSFHFVPGIGINSIQQRAKMIDAKAEILSTVGVGTTVNLTFKENDHD
jgi:signal transduction histidine kinase